MSRRRVQVILKKRNNTNIIVPDFPQITLLDDFNRADADNLGVNWSGWVYRTGEISFDYSMAKIASNRAQQSDASGSGSIWVGDSVAYNDVILTIYPDGNTDNEFDIFRQADTNNWVDCYIDNFLGPTDWQYVIQWRTAGIYNAGSNVSLNITPIAGDKLGVRFAGSIATMYLYHNNAWAQIHAIDVGAIISGNIGFYCYNDNADLQVDDFSAGTL